MVKVVSVAMIVQDMKMAKLILILVVCATNEDKKLRTAKTFCYSIPVRVLVTKY